MSLTIHIYLLHTEIGANVTLSYSKLGTFQFLAYTSCSSNLIKAYVYATTTL